MKKTLFAFATLALVTTPAMSAKRKEVKPIPAKVFVPSKVEEAKVYPSPGEIVAAAKAEEWVEIAPSDLLAMELAPDAKGKPRRVVIQLMPAPFSQGWVSNIRKLAAAHWWDGTSVNRVQDNYVTQWGDATEKKALPDGLVKVSEIEYTTSFTQETSRVLDSGITSALFFCPHGTSSAERDTCADIVMRKVGRRDTYSDVHGFYHGFPFALVTGQFSWPVHCYGMVGVGRGMSPDTGSGAELYTVIGHAPRHLDRNIALVGRVIEGIEHLSSLPRGTGPLGFYETPEERVDIKSIRLVSQLETSNMPRFEYLSTESESFAKFADARANRRDPFFIKPAGGADICNIPVPVRRKK